MSGWTILTVRGKPSKDYERAEYNDTDPYQATSDIVTTMKEDERIYDIKSRHGHVYAYLECNRYNFSFAETVLCDYKDMVRDAVVLGANDTTDTGEARYYPNDDFFGGIDTYCDRYIEVENEDGRHVGEKSLAVMFSRHGIDARDPFHNNRYQTDFHSDGNVIEEALE
jgi:hypothetical protein